MSLNNTREQLESFKNQLNAASCTFYIRDSFWTNELRLIAMPGVKYTEPMHGFIPVYTKRLLTEGSMEIFNFDAGSDKQRNEFIKISLDQIEPERQALFGDFVRREGIKSSARLIHKTDDGVEAVFFVNYDTVKEFDEPLKDTIRGLFKQLVDDLPALQDELREIEAKSINQIIRVFSNYAGSSSSLYEWERPWKEYLHTLLTILTESIPELSADNGFGTIHIYEPETETLRMIARSDNIDQDKYFPPLSILKGEGIVSWVAVHGKALLIDDLEISPFKSIHWPVKDKIRSEVAIPIFAGNELLGVLNLESLVPNAFQPIYVRSLWFAVSQAAMVYKLSQQERLKNLSNGLLELYEEWVSKSSTNFSLNKLAELATEHLDASGCEIWHYDQNDYKNLFKLTGRCHSTDKSEIHRTAGMCHPIIKNKSAVWINQIMNDKDFSKHYRSDDGWNKTTDAEYFHDSINPTVTENGTRTLLGIPILVRKKCSGVVWLEFDHDKEDPPREDFMKLALGFAAHAGLGIEFSRVDLIDKDAVERIGATLAENLLVQGSLNFDGFPGIEGFVKSQSYGESPIGGDFFAARVIDDQTACVLLGDGEGHSVNGALNMIPMLTVFEAFWKDSRSVTHVMDKIVSISNKLGVKGTAFYCVFSLIEGSLWLQVTSVGHPPLVVFQKGSDIVTRRFPPTDSPATRPMIGLPVKSPLAEEHLKLSSGDLIVIFTDGLELVLESNEIITVVSNHQNGSPSSIVEALFKEVLAKSKGEPLEDDVTVLVIRVK